VLVCLIAVGAGNTEGGLDFANMLKPALARSALQVIGATTLDEYRQHIETDPALNRRFQVGRPSCTADCPAWPCLAD
jgi:ATP-dependent Clp protease ATP-binding subunit ClpA